VLHKLLKPLPWVFSGLFIIGLIVRLSVKDHLPIFAVVYYASPVVVLAALAALAGVGWIVGKRRRLAAVSLVVACACLVWWWQVSFFDAPDRSGPDDLRIVYWNTARGRLGWDGKIETIKKLDPHLIALAEVSGDWDRWEKAFPKYAATDAGGGTMLLCKGKETITQSTHGWLGESGYYRRASVQIGSTKLIVLMVDVKSSLFLSRREAIEQVVALADVDADASLPIILLGDFNTPADSVHFDLLRERQFTGAFESHGHGYSATWPVPLPVLHIDHVWANRHLEITRCRHLWSNRSDHRPVLVNVRR
jgi:endonuclease/exonuclease/phosphatase (EEP) superfamily protein YafD